MKKLCTLHGLIGLNSIEPRLSTFLKSVVTDDKLHGSGLFGRVSGLDSSVQFVGMYSLLLPSVYHCLIVFNLSFSTKWTRLILQRMSKEWTHCAQLYKHLETNIEWCWWGFMGGTWCHRNRTWSTVVTLARMGMHSHI